MNNNELPTTPESSVEEYLAYIAGQEGSELPDFPRSRVERYLEVIAIRAQNMESADNKVTSISSSSTDIQYPSAKCVYDLIGDIDSALAALL